MSVETPARLKVRYMEEIRPRLVDRFGYTSSMQTPRIEKVTLNMAFSALESCLASPTPMLRVTFSIRGVCIEEV